MAAFVSASSIAKTSFLQTCTSPSAKATSSTRAIPANTRMSSEINTVAGVSLGTRGIVGPRNYSTVVDEFFAKDVRNQYIAKACPTGIPPIQCIEGSTASAPYELRTLKRQSQLRYRQLPVAVRLHNMYETRKNALISCHECNHEEECVVSNPMLASAMALGQAEANRACSRYIVSSGPAEDMMCRSVENIYSKAVNGSGVFSTACTDGQAKYEAYLMQVRGKSTEFRAHQYSLSQKAGAAYAAKKFAVARNHICVYEDALYQRFPRMAGSMRPAFGYYTPFVTRPTADEEGRVTYAMDGTTAAVVAALGAIIAGLMYLATTAGAVGTAAGI